MNKEIQFYSDYDGNNLALLEINNASDETILQLKEIENHIIRLRFEESPKSEKLQVLSEVLAQPHKSVFILQLLRENNQEARINIEDFKSVWNVEQLFISNRDWGFDSLKGIKYFQNLKELVLVLRYDKNLSLTPLEACHKLEKINLELPLTKKQHQELSMLQSLKKMNVRGLQTDLLQAMPAMEFLEVQGLQSTDLDKKMPNLKELLIFNSNTKTVRTVHFSFNIYCTVATNCFVTVFTYNISVFILMIKASHYFVLLLIVVNFIF